MKAALAMLGMLLLFCGSAVLLLGYDPADRDAPPSAGPEPVAEPPFADEDGSGTGPEVPVESAPSGEEKRLADLIELLGRERMSSRIRAVVGLGKIGADARDALPRLDEIIRNETGSIRYHAMAAVMQIEGSRQYYGELAEAMVSSTAGGRGPAYSILRGYDKVYSEAVFLALAVRDGRAWKKQAPPGLSAFLDRFFEDEAAGLRVLDECVAGATAEELGAWFSIVGKMKPIPAALAPALQRQLLEGGDGEKNHVIGLLAHTRYDATGLNESMVPFIRDQIEKAEPEDRSSLLSTLGGLGASDAESIQLLRSGLVDGTVVSNGAARSLYQLGVNARPAIDELIQAAEAREPGARSWHVVALIATEDQRVIPFLAKVLATGYYAEVSVILKRAHTVEGAAGLAPSFLALFPSLAATRLHGLITAALRCDPMLSRKETEELYVRALNDERPPSRRSALSCMSLVKALPAGASGSLARALVPVPDDRTVSTTRRAISAAAKLGADAAPIVPSLLRHVGDVRLQRQVFEALVTIEPTAAGCLDEFRRYAIEARTTYVRFWCVKGIGTIDAPTVTDVAILEKVAANPADRSQHSGNQAAEILNRPEWKKLRGE